MHEKTLLLHSAAFDRPHIRARPAVAKIRYFRSAPQADATSLDGRKRSNGGMAEGGSQAGLDSLGRLPGTDFQDQEVGRLAVRQAEVEGDASGIGGDEFDLYPVDEGAEILVELANAIL